MGEYIRDDGPPNHKEKAGTPTMGGCIILPVIMLSILLWAELKNIYVWLVLLIILGFGLVGFLDDYLKSVRKDSHGLSPKAKFSLQVLVALIVAIVLIPRWDFANLWPLLIAATAIPLMVIIRHRENIKRLIAGTESRILRK